MEKERVQESVFRKEVCEEGGVVMGFALPCESLRLCKVEIRDSSVERVGKIRYVVNRTVAGNRAIQFTLEEMVDRL